MRTISAIQKLPVKIRYVTQYLMGIIFLTLALASYGQVANLESIKSENSVAVATPEINTISPASTANSNAVVNTKSSLGKTSSSGQVANLIGGLALILVLIFGLSWIVKRFSQGGFAQNPAIKMLAAMPLGTRERLMLVEVGDKQILLGVTATQITNLHVFDESIMSTKNKVNQESSDFSQKLMAILQKNTANPN